MYSKTGFGIETKAGFLFRPLQGNGICDMIITRGDAL